MAIIGIKGIVKESEKAMLVNVQVTWNYNGFKTREIWMPKSVCKVLSENMAEVADWFLQKLAQANNFHGYEMCFNRAI